MSSDHAPSLAAPLSPAEEAAIGNEHHHGEFIDGCVCGEIDCEQMRLLATLAALRAESVAAPARPCECGHEWFGHGESGVSQGCYAKGCICREARPALDAAQVHAAMYDDGCISPPRTDHVQHVLEALSQAEEKPQ